MMTLAQANEFESYIRQGDYSYSRAESYESSRLYLTAKDFYYSAMDAYERAARIASNAGDSRATAAEIKRSRANSKFSEMGTLHWQKCQELKNEY